MVRVDENGNAPLNIRIPEEWFNEKEELGANWREIVGLGLRAKKDNPQLLDRIKQLETSNNIS